MVFRRPHSKFSPFPGSEQLAAEPPKPTFCELASLVFSSKKKNKTTINKISMRYVLSAQLCLMLLSGIPFMKNYLLSVH